MWNTPEFYIALFAGVSLLVTISSVIVGATIFILRSVQNVKTEILKDVNEKHESNRQRYDALNVLVIRHDTILNSEFHGMNFGVKHGR